MVKLIDVENELYGKRADEFSLSADSKVQILQILDDLKDTLSENPNRIFLCANEIGYNARIFMVKFDTEYKEFINPIIQERNTVKLVREVSNQDGKEYLIPRYTDLSIAFVNKDGKESALKLNEETSIVFSQAFDYIEGIHQADYGLEIIPEFDSATDEERKEVIENYLTDLNTFTETLDKELTSDEETRGWWTEYKFNKAKMLGQVETEMVEDQPKLNRKQRRFLTKLSKMLRRNKNESNRK